MVEGYIDVIAMVTAGFEAAVAPLGTALTEDQLALLWKMADEPILCFDGDGAGRRAAYRVVDLALPRLQPGKSLRFATLPEGQDPDDLARSGGRAALDEVLDTRSATRRHPLDARDRSWRLRHPGAARSAGSPDRRDHRRHRPRGGAEILPAGFRGAGARLCSRPRREFRTGALPAGGGRFGAKRRPEPRLDRNQASGRGRFGNSRPAEPFASPEPPAAVEHDRARLALRHADPRGADPARGDQPPLAARDPRGGIRRDRVPAPRIRPPAARDPGRCTDESVLDSKALRAGLGRRGSPRTSPGCEAAITHTSDWPAREGAAEQDVSAWWAHVVTLHRKKRTLNRELQEAERALGEEPSEANLAWLTDVQGRLEALEGGEAQIEGFGALSGRYGRGV